MTLLQVPTPAPPPPPDPFVMVSSGPPASEIFAIIAVTAALLIGAVLILGPLARALARRIEGRGHAGLQPEELEHLRERAADVDDLRTRVMELEERLDFAERMLAQRPQESALGRGDRDPG